MKMVISILLCCLTVLLIIPFSAGAEVIPFAACSEEVYGDFIFAVTGDNNAIITGYSGKATTLEIPSEINGYKVTRIYDFYNSKTLKSVTIPESVTIIDSYAFSNCQSLNKITLPNTIVKIGRDAFYNTGYYNNSSNWSDNRTTLYINNYLVAINYKTVKTLKIRKGTTVIADSLACPEEDFEFPEWDNWYRSGLKKVVIPNSVKIIPDFAFALCSNLKSVKIDNGVEKIGEYAFFDCNKLKTVSVPENVFISKKALGYTYNKKDGKFNKKINGFTIKSELGISAQKYAVKNGFAFEIAGKIVPTLKSAKRKVTVSYDKLESVKSYQIFYCEKGTKNWHKVNVVATSVILNNLKSGKTYQIKVRGKARLNKKNVYTSFSKIKTVKVK